MKKAASRRLSEKMIDAKISGRRWKRDLPCVGNAFNGSLGNLPEFGHCVGEKDRSRGGIRIDVSAKADYVEDAVRPPCIICNSEVLWVPNCGCGEGMTIFSEDDPDYQCRMRSSGDRALVQRGGK